MAETSRFPVAPGATVTAFALGPLKTWRFNGAVERGEDRVDYKFINGFVDVGDLPCRKATWDEIRNRATPALSPFDAVATNLPGFNRRVDFSGFWHLPHRLERWAKTRLVPASDGPARFALSTCGGINIWVDGDHVIAFEPFARNSTQTTEITLPLRAEGSEIVVLAEEMAERDTNFFFELTWLGETAITAELESAASAEDLETLMGLARDIRPAKPVFSGEDNLKLVVDRAPTQDVVLRADVRQSVHLNHKPPLFSAEVILKAGETTLDFGTLAGLEDGYHPLKLALTIGESRVERGIGFAWLKDQTPRVLAADLHERKAQALRFAAEHGEVRTGRILAMLACGQPWDDVADEILEDTLAGINDRRDCSDFVMVPLLWIYGAYRDALPAKSAAAIREAILNYRYWMDEPGNDAMWFWSENHVLCFHVSEFIAGRLMPDAVFPNAGLTGAEHLALAERRLGRWLDSILEDGLAEWNSAAYYPVDFIGLLALFHWSDGEIQSQTRTVLDRLFTMIALHTTAGVAAGSMGRAYDKELRAGPLNELAPFAAVAFGTGWLNNGVAALPMFCAGTYEPPADLGGLAFPKPGQVVEAQYVQGYGTAGRLKLHKTAKGQLSACVDGKPGQPGHQQHLLDVQFAQRPFARVWINHPGEDDPWGSNRPSYWAGNGVMPHIAMSGDTALARFALGDDPRMPFSHVYAPLTEFDEVERGVDWMVLRAGTGAVVLKASGPVTPVTEGPGAGIEFRCFGADTGWAVQLVDLADSAIAPAVELARAMTLTLAPETLELSRADHPALALSRETGLSRAGQSLVFATASQVPEITVS